MLPAGGSAPTLTLLDVRACARERRAAVLLGREARDARALDRLLDAAREGEALTLKVAGGGDVYGPGVLGLLHRRARQITVSHLLCAERRRTVVAHELGHWFLHRDPRSRLTRRNLPAGGEPAEGYSPDEFKEVQADVFAAEFLYPRGVALADFQAGRRPSEAASRLGLPRDLVVAQLAQALLTDERVGRTTGAADRRAAVPVAVAAIVRTRANAIVTGGPSSGRTTALVARIAHLVEDGVAPASVAAFGADAGSAEDLRRALAARLGTAGLEVWAGTPDGFCKELLRKHHARAGLDRDFRIVDDVGAISLLAEADDAARGGAEEEGRQWRRHAAAYGDIMRAKRSATRPGTASEEPGRRADLPRYRRALAGAKAVDVADLAPLTVGLLSDPAFADEVVRSHRELVVDDYGEMTAAQHAVLRILAGRGSRLFATANPHGSLNAFAGADHDAVARFERDHRGAARHALKGRRSCVADADVGRAVRAVASSRVAGSDRTATGGAVRVSVARDRRGEAAAIAETIAEWRIAGVPAEEQIVLARTHAALSRLAQDLRALGVRVLHAGEALEHDDVADLSAVARLRTDRSGRAVAHVAAIGLYGVPADEAGALAGFAAQGHLTGLEAVPTYLRERRARGMPPSAALERLARDVAGLEDSPSASALVERWLFERSDMLARLTDDHRGDASRDAIRRFLGVCAEQAAQGDDDDGNLMRRLTRLRSRSQDTAYGREWRQAPREGAVPLMTIHSAMGSKHAAVHLAALPPDRGCGRAPPRSEEVAFLSGATRARRFLHLSRSLDGSGRWRGTLPYASLAGILEAGGAGDAARNAVDRRPRRRIFRAGL